MIVDNIDYTPATLKDFVNLAAALNAFTDSAPGRHFRNSWSVNSCRKSDYDGMREYETNDNNVLKGSHVADYRTATLQIPREIASAIARSPRGTSATELLNTM